MVDEVCGVEGGWSWGVVRVDDKGLHCCLCVVFVDVCMGACSVVFHISLCFLPTPHAGGFTRERGADYENRYSNNNGGFHKEGAEGGNHNKGPYMGNGAPRGGRGGGRGPRPPAAAAPAAAE